MDNLSKAKKEQIEWQKSMGIGTLDKLYSVVTGEKLDYDQMGFLGGTKPEEHHMELDEKLIKMAGINLQVTAEAPVASSPVEISYSGAQLKALQKYPSLIEMLGNDDTGQLAEKIAEVFNGWILEKLSSNARLINKNALECKQEENFVKQYFKFDDRIGFVKAAGKFSGVEYLHYDHKNNSAKVLLRKSENKFKDVSDKFSVECHFVEVK